MQNIYFNMEVITMIKALRIGEDLDSFLNEHPEIKIYSSNGKIVSILIPDDAIIYSLIIIDKILYKLDYYYNDMRCHYEKKETQ